MNLYDVFLQDQYGSWELYAEIEAGSPKQAAIHVAEQENYTGPARVYDLDGFHTQITIQKLTIFTTEDEE